MTPLLLAATPLCGLLCATAVYTRCKLNVGFSGANVAALFVLAVSRSLTARLSAAGDEMSTDKKMSSAGSPVVKTLNLRGGRQA